VAEISALILTQSRGALLGFAVALLLLAICRGQRWRWLVSIMIAAIAVGVVLYGTQSSMELVLDTVGESAIHSGETRQKLFSRGLYMLQDFPLTGVGLGMFSKVQALFYPLLLGEPGKEVAHLHNVYLQMGVDHGLPGLIAFLALVILLCLMALQVVRLSRGRAWEPLAIGLPAGLAAYLVHGMVDFTWGTPRSHPILWGYFGLVTAVWCWAATRVTATDNDGPTDKA
jgi:putative inorganic carbon (HCO3(-)) transporter